MAYAYIVNNEIREIKHFLPKSWLNYSGFDLLSPEELKAIGWYPVIDPEDPKPWEKVIGTKYQVDEINKLVYKTYKLETNHRLTNENGILS